MVTESNGGEWVTLAEAETRTGVKVRTLRLWYRSGKIDSQLAEGKHGPQRTVRLDQVTSMAERSPAPTAPRATLADPQVTTALTQIIADLNQRHQELTDRLLDAERRAAAGEVYKERLDQTRAEMEELRASLAAKEPEPRKWWQRKT